MRGGAPLGDTLMGVLDRFRGKADSRDRTISRFGMFGPGTGLVVAMDEQVASLDEASWRSLAAATIASVGSPGPDVARDAITAIKGQAHGIDGAFLIQAARWTRIENEERLSRLPDDWFTGRMRDGRAAVPSGVKVVIADQLAVAATGLAAWHFATNEQVAMTFAPLGRVLDFRRLLDRGAIVRHEELIEPFQNLGTE